MIVIMRAEWGKANPWQVPMGQIAAATLRLAGAIVYEVTEPEAAAPAGEAAARIAFNGNLTAAVLLSQRMLGAKLFKDRTDERAKQAAAPQRDRSNTGRSRRYARGGGSGLADL